VTEVERLKQAWQTLRDEQICLEIQINELEEKVMEKTKRLRALTGLAAMLCGKRYLPADLAASLDGRDSLVAKAYAAWKRAERVEANKELPRVVWAQAPEANSYDKTRDDMVLVKTTPKRLFVRRRGDGVDSVIQYERATGKRVGNWNADWNGIIDVAATLAAANGPARGVQSEQ